MTVDRSRSLKLASLVSTKKTSELEEYLSDTTVVISVDNEVPQSRLTARVLLTTLRRGLGELVLIDDGLPSAFVTSLQESVADVDPERELTVVRRSIPRSERAVRIHVGPTCPSEAIRIVPEGYGAHVASMSSASIRPRREGNVIGAIFAASLGAAEAFKYTAQVRSQRRKLHRHLQFCPASLTKDLLAMPNIPRNLDLDLTLVGVGAIGTGIVLLLDELDAEGRIVLVDPQHFAPENVGTYSIGGAADAEMLPRKVDLAGSYLRKFDAIKYHGTVTDFIRNIDGSGAPWHQLVMTALDSAEARRDAQRLWPDRLIDAQTGDTMLGFCDYRHGIDPCMMCVFPVDRNQPSGAEILANRIGLSQNRLEDPDAVVSEEDLYGLTKEQDNVLRHLIGTPVCGLARAVGFSDLGAEDFMPSVPFVSLQAACLAVARLVRAVQGFNPTENFVQYDALCGPQTATIDLMKRRSDCVCYERAVSIQKTRSLYAQHNLLISSKYQ